MRVCVETVRVAMKSDSSRIRDSVIKKPFRNNGNISESLHKNVLEVWGFHLPMTLKEKDMWIIHKYINIILFDFF